MTKTIAPLFLIAASAALGQTPAFDVASVKATVNGEVNGEGRPRGSINATPGYFAGQNSTLSQYIQWAYNVPPYQISGPAWLDDDRFDISARAAGPAAREDLRLMLQALLAERFKLAIRRDRKELPGYALVVAKGGPKLHESTTEGEPMMKPNRAIMTTERMPMAQFAQILMQPVGSPVADMTGLTGRYDFTIDISKYVTPSSNPEEMKAGMLECLRQELGLTLEPRKLPLEILVVDHVEKIR
jgi:uncharacterized protein (TIGR03435 family)